VPRPLVIAHRGASAAFPENTVEAFRGAAELGAEWVELDARRTADGALVVHHDAHLPDGRAIVDLAAADLPGSVATLAEALDACTPMGVNIEVKNIPPDPDFDREDAVARGVIALLAERDGRDEVLISSFNHLTLATIRAEAPELATAWLVTHPPPDTVERAVAAGHRALHPFDLFVDADLVERCHGAGLAVNVWTVDDPDRIAALAELGVDGICTNVPDVARRVIDDSGGQ
jgi:glycerophosphoryl diester phosphodiesterase